MSKATKHVAKDVSGAPGLCQVRQRTVIIAQSGIYLKWRRPLSPSMTRGLTWDAEQKEHTTVCGTWSLFSPVTLAVDEI